MSATVMSATTTGTSAVTLELPELVDGFSADGSPRLRWRAAGAAASWRDVELEAVRGDAVERVNDDAASGDLRPWPFAALAPGERATIRLRVRSRDGEVTDWSNSVEVTAGHVDEWPASFIGSVTTDPVLLRTEFAVAEQPVRALLYVTAFGAARPSLNGQRVGDHELSPGWTSYQWRVDADVYDVSDRIAPGANALGIDLHGAWFTERYGFRDAAERFYEGAPTASALLVIRFASGATQTVATDASWTWSRGGARRSSLYQGEEFDAREVPHGWDVAGFDAAAWQPVVTPDIEVAPTPRTAPPVRVTEAVAPVAVDVRADGRLILDMGQNLVGRLRLRTDAPRGTRIVLRHAEVLEDGELSTRPLRNAAATDVFIAPGGVVDWAPSGTFHGFRYAEVTGWQGALAEGEIVAEVLGTDLERRGGFRTSHPLLQKLHENIVWGARGNFLSIPTDCPQRDERLGWTGDVQAFAATAAFLFDSDAFLRSWLADVRREQEEAQGIVPMVVPAVIPQVPGLFEPIAGWGDAITVVPWALWQHSGDAEVLRENLDAMIAWIEAVRSRTGGALLWEDGRQFGDWLDPDAPPDQPGKAKADPDIIATAWYARSARIVADAAEVVGRARDAAHYRSLADDIRRAFCDAYITPRGRMMSDAPAAYAIAIAFGLVDDDTRQALGDRLAELVRRRAYRISTGFAATPVICDALVSTGHPDVAGRMLLQTENPSWLYPVTMGATTVWERWDSMLEDGSVNPGQMTSFNHFALGAVADWMHRALGGLTPTAAGMRTARFAPVFIDDVDDAAIWRDSPLGRFESSWRREGASIAVELVVPDGAQVVVELPGVRQTVGAGTHAWRIDAPGSRDVAAAPTLDGPMTDVLAHRAAYRALWEEIARWDPERARALRRSLVWTQGRSLRDPLDKVPVAVMERIAARFADLDTGVPARLESATR